ncbi:MAG: COQ9 family protein [Alphaproteobacteria bacterium]|nr:COQ9 family protein [Alphaproteobacteria bacterium]
MTEREPGDDIRDTIIDKALPHVAFDGWTVTALAAGARDAGLDAARAELAFPNGTIEAIRHFSQRLDQRMLDALAQRDLKGMKIRQRIAAAVMTRLELAQPHREAVRRSLAVLALPHNAPVALGLLYRTVDAMWHAAGDTATDFNFYTKRGLLAGVVSATTLYWLNDDSAGQADTRQFLDRRIAEVMEVPKLLGRIGKLGEALPWPWKAMRRHG